MTFNLKISEPSFLYADIYDSQNKFVKRLADKVFLYPAGEHQFSWNRRAGLYTKRFIKKHNLNQTKLVKSGQHMPAGGYSLALDLEATYSSRTYFKKSKKYEFKID